MLVSTVKVYNLNNSKPHFKGKNPLKELTQITSVQKSGSVEELSKIFSEKEIKRFFLTGVLNKRGSGWEATQNAADYASFYKKPTQEEKEMGRFLDSIGF